MPLGMEVGLSPGDFVLDRDPALSKEAEPPIFGPCLLRPNGLMDQDATWYGDIVLDGDPAPLKRGTAPHFSAHAYCGQMAG